MGCWENAPCSPRTPGGEEPWATHSSESIPPGPAAYKELGVSLATGAALGGLGALLSPAALGQGARGSGRPLQRRALDLGYLGCGA